jgi:hypothetical protein
MSCSNPAPLLNSIAYYPSVLPYYLVDLDMKLPPAGGSLVVYFKNRLAAYLIIIVGHLLQHWLLVLLS